MYVCMYVCMYVYTSIIYRIPFLCFSFFFPNSSFPSLSMYHHHHRRQSLHMARSFSQSLIRVSSSSSPITNKTYHRLLSHRNQSTLSDNFHVLDLDSSSPDADLREAIAVQKIQDAIHRILVRRSAPDWLPFLPGSSYWVPPQKNSHAIAQIVHKLSNSLSDDQVMSLTTPRGWPSSSFYLHQEPSIKPSADVETPSTQLSQPEDDER